MIGALARGAFDAIEWLLMRVAARWPRVAFAGARKAGSMRQRLSGRWPAASDVQRLFPSADARAIAKQIAGAEAMSRVLVGAVRASGSAFLPGIVSLDATLRAVRGPAILATFHAGALHAVHAVLDELGQEVLVLRDGDYATSRGLVTMETTAGTDQERAAAFHRALGVLRRGGILVVAADLAAGASINVRFLDHDLRLARGPFALARLGRAPIVPFLARLENDAIVVAGGAAIPANDDEATPARALAAWFERELQDRPHETGLALVNQLLAR